MGALCLCAVCMISFAATTGVSKRAGEERGIPDSVSMRSIFHNYNYPGIDWAAMDDPKNDRVLRTCAGGATGSQLASLGISDLEERLTRLEKGNLLQRSDRGYALRFPVVVGDAHARLQASIHVTAAAMAPAVKEMVKEIEAHLKGNEEMLYHFVWSGMMDGDIAWKLLEMHLRSRLQKEAVDLTTCWWMYPDHPYQAGTNSYMRPSGWLTISWRRSTPSPDDVCRSLGASEDSFLAASVRREPIPVDKITDKLRSYGFVDASNRSTLFLLDVSSPLVPAVAQRSARLAQLAATHLDVKSIARDLDVAPERAAVIAYHELCYEILGILSATGDLTIPKVPQDNPQATRYLVSLVSLTSPSQINEFEKLLNEVVRKQMMAEPSH